MSGGQWINVGSPSSLSPGEMRATMIGDASVALYNVGGTIYATDNVCTHALAFLTEGYLEGNIIECPLHQGQFDVTTGKGLSAPISCDLKTFPVRVTGDAVEIYVE